jgi:hypothetical protein
MKRLLQGAIAFLMMAWPALSEEMPVVVELFTSQGCSSCPPADEMMHALAARDDVIALSLHVDYWDYIGWKDEFADPRNAKRQRGYARTAGRRSVYTPEMIVNGVSDIVGAKPMEVATAIERHKGTASLVALDLRRVGDTVRISAEVIGEVSKPMRIHLLRYQPQREARITRGENAGKTIHYVNVTQDWQTLETWDGAKPLTLKAATPGKWPVVVIVQESEFGPILGAARVP